MDEIPSNLQDNWDWQQWSKKFTSTFKKEIALLAQNRVGPRAIFRYYKKTISIGTYEWTIRVRRKYSPIKK